METRKHFNYNLEALRGFAALFVVIGHILNYDTYLDPGSFPNFLKAFMPNGHLAVLLFFVLSGYVIGLSTKQPLEKNAILPYLRKRFIRLYPIYVVSIAFTLLIAEIKYSTFTIIGNLLFLNVVFVDVIFENNPIWSLQYEIVYYLLFIPISFYRIKPIYIILLSFTISIVNYCFIPYGAYPLISSYLFGFVFWASGLALAKYNQLRTESEVSYTHYLSALFLFLSLTHLNVFEDILKIFLNLNFGNKLEFPETGIQGWFKSAIPLMDLSFLPYAIFLIMLFANLNFKFRKQFFAIMQFLPLLVIFNFTAKLDYNQLEASQIGGLFFYSFSIFFYFFRFERTGVISENVVQVGVWLGSISYAIYIIHLPFLVLFKQIYFFTGSPTTWIVRSVIFLTGVIFISYLLEKKFQPWVKAKF